jgi:A118 family predicted phage portal protein
VQADQFYPISFDANGAITSCVFSDQRIIGASYYTRLEYHQMTPEGCAIRNQAYKATSPNILGLAVDLQSVPAWADLEPEAIITGVTQPLFAYFRYPMANNIDPTSPLGVSCYARATDLIRDADVQWSNLLWEFESGGRALYVDTQAFGKDNDGKPLLPNKRLYRTLNGSGNLADDDMFHEWSPDLREQNILAGLDAILKKIEFSCGLAYGTLSDPNTVDKTATEIISSKQRSAATVTDCQKSLESALDDLLYAMDVWATLGNLAPKGAYDAAYEFDDSIVTDHMAQFAQDSQAMGLGVMSKVEFRMKNYGETLEIAQEKIALVQAESAASMDFFGVQTAQNAPQNMPS